MSPFGNFVLGMRYEDVPGEVLGVMRRSLLDTIGVAAVGSTTELAGIVRSFVNDHWAAGPGAARARILMDGTVASPAGAAMAGAFTIDLIDAHDGLTGGKGHAGSAVLPAILAFAEERSQRGRTISGREFIAALAVAYEVSYRCAFALHGTACDYHTSGAWTAPGVAAAGARLLGLGEDRLRHAVGIAEYHGPRSQMMRCIDHPTMLRDGVGWGSPTGVSAAYMAALGFSGAPAITIDSADAAPYWSDLGDRWEIMGTHYKPYPVCRWAHPAIDAIVDLKARHGLAAADVEKVRIETFHYATRLAGHAPTNLDEFTYAIVFPVATMLVRGQLGLDEIKPETLVDPEIMRIAAATELVETEHMNAISVKKRFAAVMLHLKDGRSVASDIRSARGDPDEPLSDAEIAKKYHLYADPLLGAERAGEIEERAARIDRPDAGLPRFLDLILAPTKAAGETAPRRASA